MKGTNQADKKKYNFQKYNPPKTPSDHQSQQDKPPHSKSDQNTIRQTGQTNIFNIGKLNSLNSNSQENNQQHPIAQNQKLQKILNEVNQYNDNNSFKTSQENNYSKSIGISKLNFIKKERPPSCNQKGQSISISAQKGFSRNSPFELQSIKNSSQYSQMSEKLRQNIQKEQKKQNQLSSQRRKYFQQHHYENVKYQDYQEQAEISQYLKPHQIKPSVYELTSQESQIENMKIESQFQMNEDGSEIREEEQIQQPNNVVDENNVINLSSLLVFESLIDQHLSMQQQKDRRFDDQVENLKNKLFDEIDMLTKNIDSNYIQYMKIRSKNQQKRQQLKIISDVLNDGMEGKQLD